MAFWGSSFIFNGIPCDDYELMMYDIGSASQSNDSQISAISIVEESLSSRWKPHFYGVKRDKKLEFSLVFGVNQERIDVNKYLERYEIENIASWLTGYNKYLPLEIIQSDLEYIHYKCIVSELKVVEYGNIPYALEAHIICDSPYAYLYPHEYSFNIDGETSICIFNESSCNDYFMPQIKIEQIADSSFSIINLSDSGTREFKFTDIPTSVSAISVDNDRCIINSDNDINLYPYFNFKFFRLVKGLNQLKVSGKGTLRIVCEFPINVGG